MGAAAPAIGAVGSVVGAGASVAQASKPGAPLGSGGGAGATIPQASDNSALLARQIQDPGATQFPQAPTPTVPVPAFDQTSLNQDLMHILTSLGSTRRQGY